MKLELLRLSPHSGWNGSELDAANRLKITSKLGLKYVPEITLEETQKVASNCRTKAEFREGDNAKYYRKAYKEGWLKDGSVVVGQKRND